MPIINIDHVFQKKLLVDFWKVFFNFLFFCDTVICHANKQLDSILYLFDIMVMIKKKKMKKKKLVRILRIILLTIVYYQLGPSFSLVYFISVFLTTLHGCFW